MEIYDDLSCAGDKATARVVIRREFGYYRKETEIEIEEVNLGISGTRRPGIAAEATRLRDDLRELQNLFDPSKG